MLIQVIIGTTRQGRFSERVAGWVMDRLGSRDDFDTELLDLRDHPLPFFEGTSPARTGRDYPRDDVRNFGEIIDRSDGFIVLTAEYNHGYSAVLKNAMDWTFVEWRRKPISFVGWGSVGERGRSNSFGRSLSSSRWHRFVTPCTSFPTS